jgi:putative tryptophan/tyrosine transport system substrate-binding protein
VRRRDFIRLLSTAAITSASSVGLSQQASKLLKLGYLSDEAPRPHLFHSQNNIVKGLHESGFDDGRNILIEYRYAAGKADQLPALANELAALPVDVILAVGTPAARAAQAATKTIPIIFCRIGDPVEYGLVTSLAHPGGNATGVTVFTVALAEKRVEVLRDAVPGLGRLAALHDPTFPPGQIELGQITAAAAALNVQVHAVGARSSDALDEALPDVMKDSPEALFIGSAALFEDNPQRIVDFASKTKLPALYIRREYVEIGRVMSYGIDFREMYRNAAQYIAKVLKGEKPADLPVVQPAKIDLVINVKTMKALGLSTTPPLLARADEVIE